MFQNRSTQNLHTGQRTFHHNRLIGIGAQLRTRPVTARMARRGILRSDYKGCTELSQMMTSPGRHPP